MHGTRRMSGEPSAWWNVSPGCRRRRVTALARRLAAVAVLLTFALSATGGVAAGLEEHPSPYLRMHAVDPVEWRAWGEEALGAARDDDRLLFVTLGYFSCYWCHVMQQESFSDPAIAARLNIDFVPVVVDRELDPALDVLLQEFVQRAGGSGGWPLNVFLTPEGIPIYGTVYLPPDRFAVLLGRVASAWRDERATLEAAAREALQLLQRPGIVLSADLDPGRGQVYRSLFLAEAMQYADDLGGGFGEQGKFPNVPQLLALLEAQRAVPDSGREAFLRLTLDRIAGQGLRDHVGGGFFRYTIDPQWQMPHFEKMLYDNAQLARVFLEAADLFAAPDYRAVAFDTLDFVLRELALGDGSFASSLSAVDGRGVEGGYYLWDDAELDRLFDERERAVATALLGLDGAPAFDAGHLPIPGGSAAAVAALLGVGEEQVTADLVAALNRLRAARSGRDLPRDDKALASWNGLLLEAFALAAGAPQGRRFAAVGEALRDWLATRAWDGKRLARLVSAAGRRPGELEDYAFVAAGLLAWSRAGGSAADRALAAAVAEAGFRRFFSPRGWRGSESTLLAIDLREAAVADGSLASSSARLAGVALALADDRAGDVWRERAYTALNVSDDVLLAAPFWHATHISVLARVAER